MWLEGSAMAIQILADSCCDTTKEIVSQMEMKLIPLCVIAPGGENIMDDETLDHQRLLAAMRSSDEPARSACPSVEAYSRQMEAAEECMVVTLSSRLSGSFNAARLAMEATLEKFPHKKIRVFDSKSASAGELRVALFIDQLRKKGLEFEEITHRTEAFIAQMDTVFLLKDLGNLVKNGRVSKLKGKLTQVLQLYPVLSDDGNGEIESRHIVRGYKAAMKKFIATIQELSEKKLSERGTLVLSHCNCAEVAEELKRAILEKCSKISDVVLVPTGGISTIYANEGGLVVAF